MRGSTCNGLGDARRKNPSPFRPPIFAGSKLWCQDRNAPQKHVWRAEIVLLTADGVGTNEIMQENGQVQDLRLALAGTLSGGRVRRPAS